MDNLVCFKRDLLAILYIYAILIDAPKDKQYHHYQKLMYNLAEKFDRACLVKTNMDDVESTLLCTISSWRKAQLHKINIIFTIQI